MRTKDIVTVMKAVSQYSKEIVGFNPVLWLSDDKNIALVNDEGDITLFEYESKGVYSGHYFLFSRGKKAVLVCRKFLQEFFEEYPVEILKGLTPVENLGARWMNNVLGFETHCVTETVAGPCLVVTMTREQFYKVKEK